MIVSTMKGEPGMSGNLDIEHEVWRKSTRSSQGADCVEVSVLDMTGEH
jgi:hypothetical protein